ncbi:branched-chain amino acid ABC transporter permease [Alsobacter metallidurans]|uniref:Branched-chain amino acid ABC transporter permease n=1 Tax=Alsobacter metallidurans TaxID=340221 RepID=A0A917MG95_9HYPH|nr:branched-chain amino acid ABC transporter permease [Alsobacter metallidurans]GGH07313.1 branched-chain amino acid ABC transporter permease [Alsobacter metallidurans]
MGANAATLRAAAFAAGLLFLLLVPLGLSRYGVYIMSLWAVMTIAAMGLNLTLGYAGQVSLAQGAFVGIGSYAVAILSTNGMPFIVPLLVAVGLSFAIGWLLGYPALRVQHHYLAFVTLAFSTLVYLVFRNEEWLTKGIYGIMGFKRPTIFGISTATPLAFYYFCLAMLAIATAFLAWIVRSPWGRAFVALRENPVRALSLGVDTRRYTLMAFAIGSAMGGFAGAVYAPLVEFVDPTPFTLALSLNILMMVIVGGSGFFFGPFLGAAIAVLLPEWLRFAHGWYLVIYAAFVMGLLIYSPTGLLGVADRWTANRKTRRASAERAAASASLSPEKP